MGIELTTVAFTVARLFPWATGVKSNVEALTPIPHPKYSNIFLLVTEEKKSRVQFLKTEMKLIELDTKIKTCLCLEKADTELCLKLLDELSGKYILILFYFYISFVASPFLSIVILKPIFT